MTNQERPDPVLQLLGGLAPMTPRAASIARVRARSHEVLARRRRAPVGGQRWPRLVTNAAMLLVAGAYLAGAIGQALRLARSL